MLCGQKPSEEIKVELHATGRAATGHAPPHNHAAPVAKDLGFKGLRVQTLRLNFCADGYSVAWLSLGLLIGRQVQQSVTRGMRQRHVARVNTNIQCGKLLTCPSSSRFGTRR